jgi:hypothetical protein
MLDSPLGRLKALLWAHSLIGAVLLVGFFAVLACDMDPWFVPAIGVCALVWIVALRPLGRQASNLSPKDLGRRPTGLPGRVLALCAGVQLVGMAFGRTPHDGLLAVAYTIALVTLMAWNLLSQGLRIPFHQKTWTICLFLAGVGLGRHLFAWSLQGIRF